MCTFSMEHILFNAPQNINDIIKYEGLDLRGFILKGFRLARVYCTIIKKCLKSCLFFVCAGNPAVHGGGEQ